MPGNDIEKQAGNITNQYGLQIKMTNDLDSRSPVALNQKQDLFCRLYVFNPKNKAHEIYQKVYSAEYNTAITNAWRLLKDPRILERIQEYMKVAGFSGEAVDKELMRNIFQNEELGVKQRAIEWFDKRFRPPVEKKEEKKTIVVELSQLYDRAKSVNEIAGASIIDGEVVSISEEERAKQLLALESLDLEKRV